MIRTLSKIVSCVVKGNHKRQFLLSNIKQRPLLIKFPTYYYTQIKSTQDLENQINLQLSQIDQNQDIDAAIEQYQKIVLFAQNHYLVSNNVEHFQIFYSALMKFFHVYITWYPIVESPIKLDDLLLNPLINQDYIKIVSEYQEEIDKQLIEKTIKSHSILSEILKDGMTIMSAKRLSDLANSYQIVYQEYYNLIKQYNSQDEMLLYLANMELPKFYFFISKLFLQKNKNEEFRKFVLLGLEQAKQEIKFILNNIQNYDQDHQARVFGQLIEYPNQLQKFYGIIQGAEQQEFLINYLQYQKEIIEQIGYFHVDQNILMQQIQLTEFLINLQEYEQALQILKFVYGQRHQIQVDAAVYILLTSLIQCTEHTKNQQFNQNEIIREIIGLQNIDNILQHDVNQLYDQKVKGHHDFVQEQLDRITIVFYKHCELVAQNEKTEFQSQKKLLNIFPLLEILILDKEQKTLQYQLKIYESLKKVKDVKLSIEKQEYEKQFYFQILYLLECDQNQIYPKNLIYNLKEIYLDFQHEKQLQIDFFKRIITLFHLQFYKGKKQICRELLNLAQLYLQVEDSQEFDEVKRIIKIQKELFDQNMSE